MPYADNCSFAVSRLTDSDLVTLFNACTSEMASRKEIKAQKRRYWIETYYSKYMNRCNTSYLIVGNRTIVATYDEYNGTRIGTSCPVHGDEYDVKTGIAVAYAKAFGIKIPDYI